MTTNAIQRSTLVLTALITFISIGILLLVAKNFVINQYQQAYLNLTNNIIQARENIYQFNHEDNKAYDQYSTQLVDAELAANNLYHSLKAGKTHWLKSRLVSNASAVASAENINQQIKTLVSNLETLLRLKVSSSYASHTTNLLSNELIASLPSSQDKLFVSQLTLKGTLPDSPSLELTNTPTFQSLENYVSFRERINADINQREKAIFSLNVRADLLAQNNFWLSQSKAVNDLTYLAAIILFATIGYYFYLQLKHRLKLTLAVQEALSASEQEKSKLALVAEHAQDAIVITDKQGLTTWVNKSFTTLSGYTLDEVKGKKPGDVLQGQNTSRQEVARISAAVQQHEAIESELINYHKDGTPYWIDIAINPTFNPQGELQNFIAVERDSTKRKAMELKLAETAEAAEVSNRAKSTFLATMSHELRTPLNGILGMAQIIETTIESEEQRGQIQVLLESGEHLLSLLNDILDFSKIEQNKLELESLTFDFDDVINPILHTYSQICVDKGLQFNVTNTLNKSALFKGDKARIRQIIFNLVSNAVKFTPEGEINLAFKHTLTPNENQGIEIKISDSGIGIKEERLATIFDPFVQAETSTTRQYGGTGLGLAIIKQLVELMDGHISIQSQYQQGTTFTIVIALETLAAAKQNQSAQQAPVDNINNSKHHVNHLAGEHSAKSNHQVAVQDKPLHILIVEDNKINTLVAKSFCARQGHTTSVAANGLEALAQLKQTKFDLILMDNHMPEMDGITATKAIRQQLKLSTTVFACTADIFQEAHDKFIAVGANFVLTKPIQEQSFLDAIKQYSDHIHQHGRSPTTDVNRSDESQAQTYTTPDNSPLLHNAASTENVITLVRHASEEPLPIPLTEAEINPKVIAQLSYHEATSVTLLLESFITHAEQHISDLIDNFSHRNTEKIKHQLKQIQDLAIRFQLSRLVKSAPSIEAYTQNELLPPIEDLQQFINLLEVNLHQASRILSSSKVNCVDNQKKAH